MALDHNPFCTLVNTPKGFTLDKTVWWWSSPKRYLGFWSTAMFHCQSLRNSKVFATSMLVSAEIIIAPQVPRILKLQVVNLLYFCTALKVMIETLLNPSVNLFFLVSSKVNRILEGQKSFGRCSQAKREKAQFQQPANLPGQQIPFKTNRTPPPPRRDKPTLAEKRLLWPSTGRRGLAPRKKQGERQFWLTCSNRFSKRS